MVGWPITDVSYVVFGYSRLISMMIGRMIAMMTGRSIAAAAVMMGGFIAMMTVVIIRRRRIITPQTISIVVLVTNPKVKSPMSTMSMSAMSVMLL